jgi:translocation and assembly module TamB
MIRKKYFLFTALAFLISVLAALIWIGNTNAGARFVFNSLARYVPGDIQFGEIKGTLAGDLRLERFNFKSSDWEVSANHVRLRWKPLGVLGGWIQIAQLYLEDVKVNDLHPEVTTPSYFTWPSVPVMFSWLKARIRSFHIEGITYNKAGIKVMFIEKVTAEAIWYLGMMNVKEILIAAPEGSFYGILLANFANHKLSLQGRLLPHEALYDLDEHHIILKLAEEKKQRDINGNIRIISMTGNSERIKLTTSVNILKGAITLNNLELREMGRPGVLRGSIGLDMFPAEQPFKINLVFDGLGFSKESESIKTVSGTLEVKGDVKGYKGLFKIQTRGKPWTQIEATADFEGNYDGIDAFHLQGKFLNGTVHGFVQTSWVKGFLISGILKARNIDTALITSDWPGKMNAELQGNINWSDDGTPKGSVKFHLLESVLRNKPLKGSIDAQWSKGSLIISQGELRGNGFDLFARGALKDQISYQARVTDIGGIIPRGAGRFSVFGWVRENKGIWTGTLKANGSAIKIDNFSIDSTAIDLQLGNRETKDIRGKILARNVKKDTLNLGSLEFNIEGKVSNHEILASLSWPEAGMTITGRGSYQEGKWSGNINKIEGTDEYAGNFRATRPVSLIASKEKVSMTSLTLISDSGEIFELNGDVEFNPLQGYFNTRWEKINLARANTLFTFGKMEGRWSGSASAKIQQGDLLTLHSSSFANLIFSKDKVLFRMSPSIKVDSDNEGIRITGQVGMEGGGKIEGHFFSTHQAKVKLPESGNFKLSWNDINIAQIGPWMPRTLNIRGKVSGKIEGKLVPGNRFDILGDTRVSGASFSWRGKEGFVRSSADRIGLDFVWKDSSLKGNIDLRFAGNGKVQSTFNLPVPAHFPISHDKSGLMEILAKGEVKELGMVTVLLPGIVEETSGKIVFDFTQTGTWLQPRRTGHVLLENSTLYLPTTGVRIKDIVMDASFADNVIELKSFMARSGAGKLRGKGTFVLKEWRIENFKIQLKGEQFQIIYLPELELLANPDITFEGSGKKVTIRGTVLLPEGAIRDRQDKGVIRASEDVVVLDRPKKVSKPLQTEIDAEISVVFGDKVRVTIEGLVGRLTGKVLLTGQDPSNIFGKGTIKIVDGKFDSYGVRLDITRGNITLDGGPVDRASLDIMAVKTFNPGSFDQIRAGVTVTGLALEPLIKLYSEPAMADSDILSYLLFGRPLRAGGSPDQTAILMKSAGVLFGSSRGAGIQEQIQQHLGLDTLEVTEGPSSTYVSSRTTNGAMERSLVTVGKYLSPRLYVSYGRSVFSDEYLVSARYSLGRRVDIETRTGTQTSVDLYYKIEFF